MVVNYNDNSTHVSKKDFAEKYEAYCKERLELAKAHKTDKYVQLCSTMTFGTGWFLINQYDAYKEIDPIWNRYHEEFRKLGAI
jgi:hypothetical protein